MRIIHKIDAFLNTIFPNIISGEDIVAVLENFYTYGSFKPKVIIENGFVIVGVNIDLISSKENGLREVVALYKNNNFPEAKPIVLEFIKKNTSFPALPTNAYQEIKYWHIITFLGR